MLRFEHVSLSYGSQKILDDLSFEIQEGQMAVLIGPSGCGKSTLLKLLLGWLPDYTGTIRLDGKDVRDYTPEQLQKQMSYIEQDVFLFNGSIKENIAYGDLGASEEAIIEAAKRANIHDYVMTLPDGYDTNIGERGVKLSGGQKQRLSIARVFLKNPPILILDEATSALDNTTEILIQEALDELCKGRTTLVVAHRLSTIKNADEIVVITGGEVREQGTHEELLAQNGIYHKLYESQFRTQEEMR